MQMLNGQEPCIVAMEACATSNYWGRVAQRSGHDVRLVPPIYLERLPSLLNRGGLNEAADAAVGGTVCG